MKLKTTLMLCAFLGLFGMHAAFSQAFTVSGTVSSQGTNLPLQGVTVSVKGSKVSTVTDQNGAYSIPVPGKGSVLVFTYVNMKAVELTTNDNTPLSLTMETTGGNMEEVVLNVGYSTQRKSVTTGAISSVKARDLERVPNGRIEQALQGRVAGVTIMQNAGQPGAGSTIRVRGITTFGGGNNPLWVVDNVVVDNGAIGYLNQSDIESIEVLKDATSAAIYGTRAATGVILVTTKKGKAGKLSVNYNGFYGTSAPAKRLDLLNATQYATLINEKSIGGGGPVLFPNLASIGLGTDWQKEIFNKDARRFSHELSLSGGTEKSTFYLSFGYQDQQGIVLSDISNYTKKSIRLNSTHKLSRVFTFGESIGYTHQKGKGIGNTNSEFGGPLSSAINLDPITKVVETDPAAIAANSNYNNVNAIRDANGNPYGISLLVGQEMTNPLAYLQTRRGNYNWSDDIVANAYLEVHITKDLMLKSSVGG
ncbi:MAG: SusC/RagA family TonB-linked outer membrane protein, partial [Ferruginibacter sp.]